MSTEQYLKAMAELGISRGGLDVDGEIDATPSGSQIGTTKQRNLLNPDASSVPEKRPMEEVEERFKCNDSVCKTAAKWWASMTPQERRKASLQRAENARKQGRRALRMYGAP